MSGANAPTSTAIGAQSKIGISREAVYGQPTQSQKLIDRVSGTLDIDFQDPNHETFRNITTDVESVPGTSHTGGSLRVVATPEGLSRLLCMTLGDPVSSQGGYGGTFYTHTWKDGFAQTPHTIQEVKGPSLIVYPGCKGSAMTVTVDKTQNTPVEIDFDVVALNKLMYGSEAAIGTDLAGFDAQPAFGPAQAQVTINNQVSNNAREISLSLHKNLGERQVLNLNRGPASHFVGKTALTGHANLYFDGEAEMKAFFGVLDSAALPYGASRTIRTVPIQLLLLGQAVSGGQYQILLSVPRVTYKRVSQPISGPNEIMQAVEFTAYHDAASGSCFVLQIQNLEAPSTSFLQNGAAITTVPANGVQPLVLP